ncbi:MAG: permease, partial [Pseudobutyrivibrio sp.]|nr:permease [Pseudobutyrivibrio sp.]
MRNPLRKRIPREILGEWKKYFALFAIITIVVGMVAGVFVANDSMETAALNAYDKYSMEDGHFQLEDEATDKLIDAFEEEDITVYKQFYKEVSEEDNTVRVFMIRDEVNKACLMEGELPDEEDEIALDRMHANNIGVSVGDEIEIDGKPMKITGLVAFPDYSTLFEDNADIMFNAMTFDVACVTEEGFDALGGDTVYQYAYTYNDEPAD